MSEVRFVVVAAGTGGHIYPGLSIAGSLQERVSEAKISFIGRPNSAEESAITKQGYDFYPIRAKALPRRISLQLLTSGAILSYSTLRCIRLLRHLRPRMIISIGGFVSVPVVLAARMLKIPVAMHEPNALPGLANKFMAKYARVVMLGFAGAAKYMPPQANMVVTGTPIRPEIMATTKEAGRQGLGIDRSKKMLLVVGGSQGAKSINESMEEAANAFKDRQDLVVLHQTGPGHFAEVCKRFGGTSDRAIDGNRTIVPYIQQMPLALAAADLIVCRAGAVTLAEITAAGLPAVVIPYPFAAEDHQRKNALELVEAGAAIMIDDGELTGEALANAVLTILDDDARSHRMAHASKNLGKPAALQEITKTILNLM